MGELTKNDTDTTSMAFFDQKLIDEFCDQLRALPIDQRKEALHSLFQKLGASSQVQMFGGNNQHVVGAYQVIVTTESFEKVLSFVESLATNLKESNPELTAELVKTIVQALANAISK